MLAVKLDSLSLLPESTWGTERMDSHELPSNLHMLATCINKCENKQILSSPSETTAGLLNPHPGVREEAH